jgi:hypothetical protein
MLHKLVPNFRDLGGLETTDNRALAPRRLIRSSALVQKSRRVREAIVEHLPAAIYVDLRMEAELIRDGVPELPSGWHWRHRPVYDIDLGRPIARPNRPEALRRYTEVVAQIAVDAADAPVVVACSLGKDRTGVVIALLLQWLGVRRELILHDFGLSDLCLLNARRQLPKYWRDERNLITRADVRGCKALLDLAAQSPVTPPAVAALAQNLVMDRPAAATGKTPPIGNRRLHREKQLG